MCGEKGLPTLRYSPQSGSPPHVRGKEHGDLGLVRGHRITPAYAGKSGPPLSLFVLSRDRPRVCGEKSELSSYYSSYQWITPAYAGKSCSFTHGISRVRDHPRVCGEKQEKALQAEE